MAGKLPPLPWVAEKVNQLLSPIRPQELQLPSSIARIAEGLRGGQQPVEQLIKQLAGKPGVGPKRVAEMAAGIPAGKRLSPLEFAASLKEKPLYIQRGARREADEDALHNLAGDLLWSDDLQRYRHEDLRTLLREAQGELDDRAGNVIIDHLLATNTDSPDWEMRARDAINRYHPHGEEAEFTQFMEGNYRPGQVNPPSLYERALELARSQLPAASGSFANAPHFGMYQRQPLARTAENQGGQYFESVLRGGVGSSKNPLVTEHFTNPSQLGHVRGTLEPSGHRLLLEELQSDPLEHLGEKVVGKDIYPTLGKMMLERAAQADIPSVAFPTAERIGGVRGGVKPFMRDIYDKEMTRKLFEPLRAEGVPVWMGNDEWVNVELPSALREAIQQGKGPLMRAEGGRVSTKDLTHDYGRAALGALSRFFKELPNAAREWPRQAYEMVRMPADIVMGGTPEEKLMEQLYGGEDIRPLPNARGADTFRAGSPEARAHHVAGFANPLANAVFAPKQTLAMANSPMGRATLGGLAALMTGVGDVTPAMAGVVKNKGGNWLQGSVEDALRSVKRENRYGIPYDDYMIGPEPDLHARSQSALNTWIDKQLTRYVKNDMATPEDPIRALAEQGVLHTELPQRGNTTAYVNRSHAGYPTLSEAKTEQAQRWEDLVDAIPNNATYRRHVPFRDWDAPGTTEEDHLRRLGGDFAVKNPETNAYAFNRGISTRDLGFDHLIDELSNALNPESGLPQHLQLTADKLNKVSVPQAVQRVADINAWRAAQQAEANKGYLSGPAVQTLREYAENNPKGLRWLELRAGDKQPLEGGGVAPFTPEQRKALEAQLKYEGDAMGHCVGGYCPDVLEGRSRIFSLRDAKGEPHVTVEVDPSSVIGRAPESDPLPRIVQIKGKANRAPNEEYLPFVQDFVRNSPLGGTWSDVGDLRNAGLRRTRDVWNDREQQKIRAAGKTFSDYVSPEEIRSIADEVWPGQWGSVNFAHGGHVQKQSAPTDSFQGIIAALEQELA